MKGSLSSCPLLTPKQQASRRKRDLLTQCGHTQGAARQTRPTSVERSARYVGE